jgi:hypothetical protein
MQAGGIPCGDEPQPLRARSRPEERSKRSQGARPASKRPYAPAFGRLAIAVMRATAAAKSL